MKKSALLVLMAIALFSQTVEAKRRLWRAVPGFKYIFVDEASIHRQRPPLPSRDDRHLRPWDTTADIKVDGQTYPEQQFWCVPRGKVQFGPLGASWLFTVWPPKTAPGKGRFPKTALDAVEHVVCVDLEPVYLPAQTEAAVQVHVSAETCLVGNLEISCSDVGAKLRELGTPLEAQIHVVGDAHASYKATSTALQSLRSAGLSSKWATSTFKRTRNFEGHEATSIESLPDICRLLGLRRHFLYGRLPDRVDSQSSAGCAMD